MLSLDNMFHQQSTRHVFIAYCWVVVNVLNDFITVSDSTRKYFVVSLNCRTWYSYIPYHCWICFPLLVTLPLATVGPCHEKHWLKFHKHWFAHPSYIPVNSFLKCPFLSSDTVTTMQTVVLHYKLFILCITNSLGFFRMHLHHNNSVEVKFIYARHIHA